MNTIEDLLNVLFNLSKNTTRGFSDWDRIFLSNVHQMIYGDIYIVGASGIGSSKANATLSTKQADTIKTIATKNLGQLVQNGCNEFEITSLIENPIFRNPPYVSKDIPREVRWIGSSLLAFRTKKNARVIDDIKKLKTSTSSLDGIQYPQYKDGFWVVMVTTENIDNVMNVIQTHKFEFDESVVVFLAKVSNSGGLASEIIESEDELIFEANNDKFLLEWINAMSMIGEKDV